MAKGFEFENKFNTDNAFTSVKFGYDRPILETELNEMQEIQNYNRKLLANKICKSGIIELVDKDFKGDPIIYNPEMERNKIAIAPMKVNINGYDIHVCGNYQIGQIKNYLLLDLDEAPDGQTDSSKYREDLIYLETWFDTVSSNDKIYKYGNIEGQEITNTLIDERVGEETSRRTVLKWKIKIAKHVDFDKWEYGFGYNYNSTNNYSPIYTDIVKNISVVDRTDKVFANATHLIFQGCNFYGDNNLWVAGRPYSLKHSMTIKPYVEEDGTCSYISINKVSVKADKKEDEARDYIVNDNSMTFFGNWESNTDNSNNPIETTNDPKASVTLNFTGDNLKLYVGNIIKKGKYVITIDNKERYVLDLENNDIKRLDNGNILALTIDTLYSYESASNTKDSEYVFAMPLFKISRRNKSQYGFLNPNGSVSYNNKEINLRPDGKCYDMIYESDILDLRKNVIINNNDINYYLDNTLEKIFSGKLQTKSMEKMRRIQFGIEPISEMEDGLIFLDSFNQNNPPIIGNKPLIEKRNSNTKVKYKPSVTEWGLSVDGNIQFVYNISNSVVNTNEGTIDFFIIANWNGFDKVNQHILTLKNGIFNYPFLTVEKINNKLVIKRYADSTNEPRYSFMQVNINKLFAKRVNHIRICWSFSNNTLECYLNGKFIGNSLDEVLPDASMMLVTQIVVGKIEELENRTLNSKIGFTIDELAMYNIYKGNKRWTLPEDYLNGDALILPSMNSIFRNFRDNEFMQKDMVTYVNTTMNQTKITISSPYNCNFANTVPKVYLMSITDLTTKAIKIGDLIEGTWSGLNTDSMTFTLNTGIPTFTKFTGETVAIVYDIVLSNNNTIYDIPNEVLKAQIYKSDKGLTEEMSFNIENNTNEINEPREVNVLINKEYDKNNELVYTGRRYLYDICDKAYDFSTYRNDSNSDFAFVRLLEYHMSGNRTSLYSFETYQYGYEVLYIRNAYVIKTNKKGIKETIPVNIEKIEKLPGKKDPSKIYYNVYLDTTVSVSNYVKFELALGGSTIDYNTVSKCFIGNTSKAEYVEFNSTGNTFEYTIPCNNVMSTGLCNKGVIHSIGRLFKHEFDSVNNEIIDPNYKGEYICFVDGQMHTYEYIDGLGKPFIKIRISDINPVTGNEMELPEGQKIQIPVFMSYQPTSNDIISVWYNYTPYQGILNKNQKKLKRLSDWKYFITTLSSGNKNDKYNKKYSMNNIINRLPGGATNSSHIIGQDINLKSYDFNSFNKIDGYSINKNLIFINQTYIGTMDKDIDSTIFELDTDYIINKKYDNIQDDEIIINDKDFKVYLPVLEQQINKYCGMACIVSDEYGDLFILILGDLNNCIPSINSYISPKYGDLFIIPHRPGSINRKN